MKTWESGKSSECKKFPFNVNCRSIASQQKFFKESRLQNAYQDLERNTWTLYHPFLWYRFFVCQQNKITNYQISNHFTFQTEIETVSILALTEDLLSQKWLFLRKWIIHIISNCAKRYLFSNIRLIPTQSTQLSSKTPFHRITTSRFAQNNLSLMYSMYNATNQRSFNAK